MDPIAHIREVDTITDVVNHLNMFWDETRNIPTKSLNINGKVIQDRMYTYLENGDKYYSSSDFKEVIKSPFHLKYYRESGYKDEVDLWKKKSAAFDLGTFLHSAILEPTKFDKMIETPNHARNKKDSMQSGIDWWKRTILEKQGEEFLTELEDHLARVMSDGEVNADSLDGLKFKYDYYVNKSDLPSIPEQYYSICKIVKTWYYRYGDGLIPRLLKHSKREVSVYDDNNFQLPLKVRPDAMLFEENVGRNIILSVKSTRSPYPRKFFNDYANFEYPVSDAMYNEVVTKVTGREFDTTLCVMVQNTAPYGVGVFMVKSEDLAVATSKFYSALATAKECEETGLYPGFEALAERGNMGISPIHLPSWYNQDLLPIDLND